MSVCNTDKPVTISLADETPSLPNQSDTPINPPLPGLVVWRDLRGFFRLESTPHPSASEYYIRCDILPTLEQVNFAQRRIEKCSQLIGDYRDQQSKSKPNSTKWKRLEKSIKSMEREIAQERQYIEFLVDTQSDDERDRTDSEANAEPDDDHLTTVHVCCEIVDRRRAPGTGEAGEAGGEKRAGGAQGTREEVQKDSLAEQSPSAPPAPCAPPALFPDESDSLTELEQLELENCEKEIEIGIKSFYKMGKALLNIRDKRLYRKTHDTFADYCETRWDMSRRNADFLIQAAVVMDDLRTIVLILPANEAQVRPLSRLRTADERQQAWQKVLETAPSGKVTAAHVASVVKEIKSVKQKTSSEKQQAGASLSDAGSEGGDRGEPVQPEHETQQNSQDTKSDTQDAIRYNPGDLVRIQCPKGALPEQKAWDGCWAIVQSTGNISCVRVLVGGCEVNYMAGDLDWDDNSDPQFRETCERILNLWQKAELEPVEESLLKFLQHRPFFTDLEIQMISLMEIRHSVN